MPKIDIDAAPTGHGTSYPEAFAGPCKARRRFKLGDAAGLDQFGVNLLRLPAGAWSSQRHWHQTEDEFVWVVSGEVVLEVGTRKPGGDHGEYPDIDMTFRSGVFSRRDGTAFPKHDRRT